MASIALFAAKHRGLLIKLGLAAVAAALIAWGFYALVVQPRAELAKTQQELSIASAERDQARLDLANAKTQAMMNAVIGQAQADVAKEAAANRQVVADKAAVRDVQTTTIRERIVERAAEKGDGLDRKSVV